MECPATLQGWWLMGTHTLSPHFVPTLCRKRKSKRKFRHPVRFRCAMEPAVSAVCCGAHEAANVTAGDGGLQRSGFSVRIRCACTEPPRPPLRHRLAVRQLKGRASRPRHAATRCDRRAAHKAL